MLMIRTKKDLDDELCDYCDLEYCLRGVKCFLNPHSNEHVACYESGHCAIAKTYMDAAKEVKK